MTGRESPHREAVRQDDLGLIYKDKPTELAAALCSIWPTKLNWEHTQDGKQVSVGLHGVAAAIMFLRRMYAFLGGEDLSGGKPTILTQLSWREVPLSDETEPEVLQALLQELGISAMEEGKDPSLLEVLTHDSMQSFWGPDSMSIYSTKYVVQKAGEARELVNMPPRPDGKWKREFVQVGTAKPIELQLKRTFQDIKKPNEHRWHIFNAPPFIRVCYHGYEAGLQASPSFSDLRSFRFRALTLANETNAVEEEHIYVLIACYLDPDEKNENGELRLYSEGGVPILPKNGLPREWQNVSNPASRRRIGQPGLEFVALYGKTDNDEEDLHYSELPSNEAIQACSMPSFQYPDDVAERALKTSSASTDVPQKQLEETSTTSCVHERLLQDQQQQLESHITELDSTIENLRNIAASTEKDKDGQVTLPETAAQKTRRLREERNEALAELEEAKAEVAALKGRILMISEANESYTELNEELNKIVESLREQIQKQAQDPRDTSLVDALLERIQSINTVAHKVDEAYRELFERTRASGSLRQS
ncbi:hypothetical protein EV127DRAFT_516950 [Xylaria flabelliformis]|nr:hypothetical protein EV127DRAFT_516950 [Xylaria flabelliformis]